jgi:hypothetical protein
MPATIKNNTIELQPDNVGYQAFRIPISQPQKAETMVFYYKAYVDNMPASINEDGTNYGWNNDSFFGLSFSGTVSANTGNIVGWSNGNDVNTVASTGSLQANTPFSTNSGYSQMLPFTFDNSFYMSNGNSSPASNIRSGGIHYGNFCPSTNFINLSGAQKFLGILKVSKHPTNTQQIVLSYGVNWENMTSENFSTSLLSISTTWIIQSLAVTETTRFRSNHLNPLSANTINMPNWIVGKWASSVSGRKFVISDMKVEYYTTII